MDSNKQIPFIHVNSGNTKTATGSILYIMSPDYPELQTAPSSDQTSCVITFPQHTAGSISFLDIGYISSQYSTCPVRIALLDEYRCAVRNTDISWISFEAIN